MNCKDFHHWLAKEAGPQDRKNPHALEHMAGCESCRNLYSADAMLEKQIESAFFQQELPGSLEHQICQSLDHDPMPRVSTKKRTMAVAVVFSLVFVLGGMLLFFTPFRYKNLQELSKTAVSRHLSGDTTMTFNADAIEQALAMMSRELKFNVVLPDLPDKGYVLLGGRLCVLGKCKIAYLFYEKDQKLSSLFILDYGHLDFEMADGSRFSNDLKGFHTDIWKEKGQVYAMVY
jgi:hypothetical protein